MDPLLLVAVGVLVLILAIFVKLLSSSSKQGEGQDEPAEEAPARAPRVQRDVAMAGGRRVRAPRNRMHRAVRAEDSDEENDDGLPDDIELPEGKVGAKKLRKLQEKEEKRRQREAELQEREEKKRREALLEEKRKKDDAREAALEKAREEEERLKKEEEEKREHEEYLKMKEMFSVDEEGTHEAELNQDTESLLQEFIDYIKQMKVVILEDLASHFKLKTQEAIDRVRDLQEEGRLSGVIDDRGKFIYITQEEYESVAKFINQRGRVSMTELAESSNILINLNPDNTETLQKKLLGEQSNQITASA